MYVTGIIQLHPITLLRPPFTIRLPPLTIRLHRITPPKHLFTTRLPLRTIRHRATMPLRLQSTTRPPRLHRSTMLSLATTPLLLLFTTLLKHPSKFFFFANSHFISVNCICNLFQVLFGSIILRHRSARLLHNRRFVLLGTKLLCH